ncbi:MAG: endolytic transglycosylase MltG [Coriobacteriia bacterium]|nr:endolytic transglycosylase MltG [Coriobacteriia bacterium]
MWLARVLVGVVVLVVLLGAVAFGAVRYHLYRPDTNIAAGASVHVVIESGSSTAEIAEILSEAGVIENALMFRWKTRQAEADGKMRAGEYDLSTGMPYDLVMERLIAGPVAVYFKVPVPEGFTAVQVAERFAERAQIPADELTALVTAGAGQFAAEHPYLQDAYGGSLEGFLFPATYTVEEGASAQEVVEMMLDHFDSQIAGLDLSYATSQGLDLTDVVIIASILERESKLAEEFPLVSSVIYNRLAKPMRLQLCATVLYELPPGTTSLTEQDLKLDSPYNTYIHDGLPVGPISNPGMAALQAAATPAETDYLYYVLTGADGSQTFTRTYDEFLKAKQASRDMNGG